MTVEEAIVAHLEGDMDVAGLVDNGIYAGRKPANAPHPLIVYRRVTTRVLMSHDGSGLRAPLFQFTCYGETEAQARAVGRAVAAAFDVATLSDEIRTFVVNELEVAFADAALPAAIVDVRVWFDPTLQAAS